jgi:DNA-binding response OmpR family regulator
MSSRKPGEEPKDRPPRATLDEDTSVLVLDDEPSIRGGLAIYLGKHGYTALRAGTFDEAVTCLSGHKVGAVILDVRLPGSRTGLDLLAQLRSLPHHKAVPAIVLTGGLLTEDEERAVTKHRAHLFYKPEGFSALVDFLKQLMGRDQPH